MAGAITLLSVATLAACSKSSEGADLITMKGDVITEHQFFEEVKNNSVAQQVLLNMTIQKVFEKQYGSEVSDKEVEEAVAEEQKKYGDSYQTVLARAGMTPESRKAQIRTSKLVEYAVKKAAEAELTDENYKKAYDEYTPEVTAQVIRLDSEEKAKEVLAKAKESGADFAQLAKDNSVDEKAKEFNLIFMEEGNIKIKIFDDVIPFMKKIKKAKKKIAIITNGPTDGQMSKLKVTGLLNYIDHIYISEEVGAAKPSKAIFNFAMHDLGALPKESVMFGDNIKEDIFGAKSVGMSAILVNRFNKNISYNNQIKNFFELDNI